MSYYNIIIHLISFIACNVILTGLYVFITCRKEVRATYTIITVLQQVCAITLLALPAVFATNVLLPAPFVITSIALIHFLLKTPCNGHHLVTWNVIMVMSSMQTGLLIYNGSLLSIGLGGAVVAVVSYYCYYRTDAPRIGIPCNMRFFDARQKCLLGDEGFTAALNFMYWDTCLETFKETGEFDWAEYHELIRRSNEDDD